MEKTREDEIPFPKEAEEIPLCKDCAHKMKETLLYKILNDDSTLETKIDACGDTIINLWKKIPALRTYIEETLHCVISNTLQKE